MKSKVIATTCTECNKQQQTHIAYNPDKINHILHLLLSVCTMGIWVLVWLILWAASASRTKSNIQASVVGRSCKYCEKETLILLS